MLSYTRLAVDQAEAQTYAGAGGVEVDLQETALMRGQRYIAARFNDRWRNEWNSEEAPENVRLAIIEAGIAEAKKPGILAPVSTPATDKVLVGAGKLSWERVGDASAPDAYLPRLPVVEGLLASLIRPEVSGFFMRSIGR